MADPHVAISDDQLAAALEDQGHVLTANKEPLPVRVCDLAAEIIRNRRVLRKDSRRAEQLKKYRWTVENLLTKLEAAEDANDDNEQIPEAIAAWFEAGNSSLIDPAITAAWIREGRWR